MYNARRAENISLALSDQELTEWMDESLYEYLSRCSNEPAIRGCVAGQAEGYS